MLDKLTWEAVEAAYTNMLNEGYEPETPLMIFIEPEGDNDVRRQKISVETFRKSLWHLYESRRTFVAVAVMDPDNNAVIFHHGPKKEIDEGMPPEDGSRLVQNWNRIDVARRKTLLKMLEAEIIASTNAG